MQANAESSTPISTRHFRLNLPGAWDAVTTNDPTLFQYRAANSKENISLTVLRYAANSPDMNPQKSLEQFLEVRRKMENSAPSQGQVELTPVKYRAQGSGATGSYSGSQQASARRLLAFAIANKLGIVLFYYELLDATAAEFESRSRVVLGTVQLVE